MKINLQTLSLAELKSLGEDIEMELRTREEREKLVQEFRDKAKAMGMSLEDLMTGQKTKSGKVRTAGKVAAKYANPADKSQTWTGRGKQPRWVVAALAAGKKLDDLKI